MRELKRKKQQLEHQLAERQKQEQVVKVMRTHSLTILLLNDGSLISLGHSQYLSTDRDRSDSSLRCSRHELFRELSPDHL